MGAVDILLANISKHGGLAKPNRFLVQIALPPSRQFAEQFQRLTSQEDIGPPEQGLEHKLFLLLIKELYHCFVTRYQCQVEL